MTVPDRSAERKRQIGLPLLASATAGEKLPRRRVGAAVAVMVAARCRGRHAVLLRPEERYAAA
jgi:hypothetical protein